MPIDEKDTQKLSEVALGNKNKPYNAIVEQDKKIFKIDVNDIKYMSDAEIISLFERAEKLGLINQQVVVTGGLEINEISDWQYSTDDGVSWDNITIPHTCNATDATTAEYFRGSRKYKTNFSIPYTNKYRYLLFEKVGQSCDIYLNGVEFATHKDGYNPFVLDLTGALKGNNEILLETNNEMNENRIPISGNFNIENGMYGRVYLITTDTICFDPTEYGHDRMHVTMLDIDDASAMFRINAKIIGKADSIGFKCLLRDNTNTIVDNYVMSDIKLQDVYNFSRTITLNDPHLWNGIEDPYLYTVELELYNGDYKVDTIKTKVGLKYFSLDQTKGFMLNGKEYDLHGFGIVQDYPGKAMAMRTSDFDKDFEIIKESGANFLKLAYYPHDEYVFKKCDELGIIVQTEVPWINHCGSKATTVYFDNIKKSINNLINNFYNHTSLVFVALNDNLNNTNLDISVKDPQGSFDYSLAKEKTLEMYTYSRSLTDQHLIGIVANDNLFDVGKSNIKDWLVDWIGFNQYKGWDAASIFDHFGENMDLYRTHYKSIGVSEYGAGGNIDKHSDDPIADRNTTNRTVHYEEYQNLFHESYLEQIESRKWFLFTSAWCLFDYAVSGLNEGSVPFQNDKGLITRDRNTYKDSFYLYKAKWSKEPVAYITSRRHAVRSKDNITIKVYSNAESITLYQNDMEVQTLDTPTKCGVVWEFDNIKFKSPTDVFKIIAIIDGISYTDLITVSTNSLG